jgi:hypothetical protein
MSLPKRSVEPTPKRSDEETQDEIEQIMSEIEQLQKEIGQTDPTPRPVAAKGASHAHSDGPVISSGITETDPLEEFRAGAGAGDSDGGLEDTLGDLKGEETNGKSVFDDEELESEPEVLTMKEAPETSKETREAIARASREVEEAFENEDGMHEHDESGKSGDGALTMTLRGNMTLKLQYETEGQVVSIGFADHALRVQLADGTEFKIPMRARVANRRAA